MNLTDVSTRVNPIRFTFTSHYHCGGRQDEIRLVTGGPDGAGVREARNLADRNE